MPWSLVEILSGATAPRRAFYPPLASIPPGSTTVRVVDPNVFTPSDETTVTNDKVFNIRIAPPFTPEGTLPDPAIRLHAMAPGWMRFRPQDATMEDSLIVDMPMFLAPVAAPWWERWVEAECLPYQIIYENVDRAELEARLQSLPLGSALHGLSLPPEIADETRRPDFIANFFAGMPGHLLSVESGAIIGTAATDPAGGADRLLKLRARYQGHTDAAPRFMNPREFLHLLFGTDSDEFLHHPLLLQINSVGRAQPGLESKTMRLRPPLRTHARVMWESDFEIVPPLITNDWALAESCAARFYNDHARQGRHFNNGGYVGSHKCNLFISDVALRSGFRCCIHAVMANLWHYNAAGTYTNNTDNAGNATDRIPLRGNIEGTPTTWGFKFERWLRAIPAADRQARVNELMTSEGRCLILAGSRAVGSGHIVIVESVGARIDLVAAANAGHGLTAITLTTREAQEVGGRTRINETFSLAGPGGGADATSNFVRLHLFELHPGKDPDTLVGLRDCNVQT